jgi:hypothetical protein
VITVIASAEDAQSKVDLGESGNCQNTSGQDIRLDGGLVRLRWAGTSPASKRGKRTL